GDTTKTTRPAGRSAGRVQAGTAGGGGGADAPGGPPPRDLSPRLRSKPAVLNEAHDQHNQQDDDQQADEAVPGAGDSQGKCCGGHVELLARRRRTSTRLATQASAVRILARSQRRVAAGRKRVECRGWPTLPRLRRAAMPPPEGV